MTQDPLRTGAIFKVIDTLPLKSPVPRITINQTNRLNFQNTNNDGNNNNNKNDKSSNEFNNQNQFLLNNKNNGRR